MCLDFTMQDWLSMVLSWPLIGFDIWSASLFAAFFVLEFISKSSILFISWRMCVITSYNINVFIFPQ